MYTAVCLSIHNTWMKIWLVLVWAAMTKIAMTSFPLSALRQPGCTFFGSPESGFIQHQLPPPCYLSLTPGRSKSYPWDAWAERSVPRRAWPPRLAPGVCPPRRLEMALPKATGDYKGLRVTVNRQNQIGVVIFFFFFGVKEILFNLVRYI